MTAREHESDAINALTTLATRLTGTRQPETIVSHLAETLECVLAPDRLLVILNSEDEGGARLIHERSWTGPRSDHPIHALLHSEGAGIYGREVSDRAAELGAPLEHPPSSWMVTTIVAARRTLGTVCVAHAASGYFSDADLAILNAAAAQAALALVNADLLRLLSAGKREWEKTVDTIPQAFCMIDSRGTIQRANRAFADLVGVPIPTLANRPWHAVMPAGATAAVARALAVAGTETDVELKLGTRLYTASALPTGSEADSLIVLVLEDQTDKRALQDQVVQSAKMSAIGQLIAGIAHDLNNPLASVVGFAEYLTESKGDLPPRLVEPLRAIYQEAERATKIVKNLLAFARKQEGEYGTLSVGPILESTLLLLKNQLMAYRVQVELTLADDLPTVDGNANQLQQVFVNVITNAAQAIHASGEGGTIRVTAEHGLDGVAVIVQDDGPGVAEEIAGQVFEPFFTTKPEGEGTGLGLSICHGIVTEHGGRIQLAQGGGAGATIRIELPRGNPVGEDHRVSAAAAASLRILLIDDEPHILHYMRAALEDWGHTVQVAADGRAGLELATSHPYELIITDLRMPEVGGREFYQALDRDHPDIAERVVFCTGDTVGRDALAFLESVGRPHLKKPFTLTELRRVLPGAGSHTPSA